MTVSNEGDTLSEATTIAVEPTVRLTFGLERKVSDNAYGHTSASAYVGADLPTSADQETIVSKAAELAAALKIAVFTELGIEFTFTDGGQVVEQPKVVTTAPATTEAQAESAVKKAFGGGSTETSERPQGSWSSSDGVRIVGKAHGPVPEWLKEGAVKRGSKKVFDNRDKAEGTKRPWFVDADDRDIAYWPPKD